MSRLLNLLWIGEKLGYVFMVESRVLKNTLTGVLAGWVKRCEAGNTLTYGTDYFASITNSLTK